MVREMLEAAEYISYVHQQQFHISKIINLTDVNHLIVSVWLSITTVLNPLMPILKPQSNEPLYCNTVIGTLAVDGWDVIIWYSEEGPGWAVIPPSPLLAVPNVTAHASTATVPTSCYLMWHYKNCLWTLKG